MKSSKMFLLLFLGIALAFSTSLAIAQDTNTGGPAVLAPGGLVPSEVIPASNGIIVDLGPGTGAPPSTLGGLPMTPVPYPGAPACTGITPPLPVGDGGVIGISPVDSGSRCIGSGWVTWSHGYTGDVYYTGGPTTQVLTLPSNTKAVYFYVEPNPFSVQTFEAIAQPGDISTGVFSADGSGGATYVGFYATGSDTIQSITINCSTDFATGEFGWNGEGDGECVESLVGDKDGFGVGCPIESGLHYLNYGDYWADYRELDDPAFTDYWYTGDKSWYHDYSLPPDSTNAEIEVFLAGVADIGGNASLLVNGQVVATIPYEPDWHDVTRLVIADVPLGLLVGHDQAEVTVAYDGDGYIIDYSQLTVCGDGERPCVEDDSGELDIVGAAGGPGGTLTIPVRIQSAPNGVESLGFEVVFPDSLLTFTGYTKGPLVEGFDFFGVAEPEPGILRIGGFEAGADKIATGASGDVVYLDFNVIGCEQGSSYPLDLQELKDGLAGWSASLGCFQCGCDCDINGDGEITPQDALCAFQKYLGICPTACGPCDGICCDVTMDGDCTPADALEIFKEYLGLPSVCSPEPV